VDTPRLAVSAGAAAGCWLSPSETAAGRLFEGSSLRDWGIPELSILSTMILIACLFAPTQQLSALYQKSLAPKG
jgi:hypothetical protein